VNQSDEGYSRKLLPALSKHFGHGSLGRRCGLLSNYFDLLFFQSIRYLTRAREVVFVEFYSMLPEFDRIVGSGSASTRGFTGHFSNIYFRQTVLIYSFQVGSAFQPRSVISAVTGC